MSSAVVAEEVEKVKLKVPLVQIYRNIIGPFEDNITQLNISKKKLEWLQDIAWRASELVSQNPSIKRQPPLGNEPSDPERREIYRNIMLPIASNVTELGIMPEDLEWIEPITLEASSLEADRRKSLDNKTGILPELDRILLEAAKEFPEDMAKQKLLAQGSSNIRRAIDEIRSEAIKAAQSKKGEGSPKGVVTQEELDHIYDRWFLEKIDKQIYIHLVPDASHSLTDTILAELGVLTSDPKKSSFEWTRTAGNTIAQATGLKTKLGQETTIRAEVYARESDRIDIYLSLNGKLARELMQPPEYQNPNITEFL